MKSHFLFSILLFIGTSMTSQSIEFKNATQGLDFQNELSQQFYEFETYQINEESLNLFNDDFEFDNTLELNFGEDHQWEFELYSADMFSEDAIIRILTENGEIQHPVPRNISFKGHVKGNPQQQVSLLIHGTYIYAHITEGTQRTYISSLNKYVKNAPQNIYLVFERSDQKENDIGECGISEYPEFDLGGSHSEDGTSRSQTNNCYDVELGIVSDWLLYTDKGSTIAGAMVHAVGVMMDVETDYELADFDDELDFEIVEQVVSTCEFCDEWTASTDSGDLLDDFTSWAGSGGFNNSIDMGQFWTNRNFDGSTVGLAWNGTGLLCSQAYHVLEDFSSDADDLRVLTSHEIGHNLNADHNMPSTGDIMDPIVSNTTTWSTTSVTTIDATVDLETATCIVACTASVCDSVTDVSITSINATGFTISWTATSESLYRLRVRDEEDYSIIHTSTPSSSTAMTITPAGWESCHQYMVIVENDCGGSGYSAPVSTIISDSDQGCAKFSADDVLDWGTHTVLFTDESTDATSWSWDFGDTNTSTSQNPSHTYTSPGIYDVELSINSGAHSITKTDYIYVLPNATFPYSTSDGGDMTDDDFGTESETAGVTSIFERGIPSNFFTNSTTCWVTDLDADVADQDNESWLYSPRFDFTNVATATLSFDLGMEHFFNNAPYAVQVHYSTNDGSAWTRLGADTDTGWYSCGPSKSCQIHTAIFADEMGWLYTGQSTTYSYDVGSLAGNSSVIFGFVFNVEDGFSSGFRDGAMVDNFALAGTLLPIELISFDGKRSNSTVNLNWQTATEINNDFFTLQRSVDGRTFETIANIDGQGTTYEMQSYKYFDNNPALGVNYYRLSQTDFDGKFEVFDKIVAIDFVSDINVKIIPNPVEQDNFQLVYNSKHPGDLHVEIYSITGSLLYKQDFKTDKDLNYFDISLSGLSNGIYVVKTNQNNFVENIRFVKTN